jgi:hypothetical protein
MKEIFFWKVWSASERRMAVTMLAVLLLGILYFVFKSIDPLQNVIRWNVVSELSELNAVIDFLRIGQWQYGVSTPSHLVTENFMASVMEIDSLSVWVFWTFTVTGLCLILAALTTLSRFWYLAGMVVFILFLGFSRLEVLSGAGQGSRFLFIITVLIYTVSTYYFHAFRQEAGIVARIIGMFIASGLVAFIIGMLSAVPYPALALASYSFPLWLILTTLFLLICSTEIMAGMVWLSTSGSMRNGKTGLINFIVISILYLVLLLLIYLRNTKQVDWNLTLVSPIVLALVAGIAGIWGFRRRADSTEGMLPFRSAGFWLYIGLFIIALAFGGLMAATANDPVLEALEDITIQGQLAMSILFFFYILVNFYPLFQQKLAVYKVLYKPLRFGLTQTRLFGFAGVVLLFSIQRLFPVNQAIAGYFNGLGDLHATTQEFTLSEQYYKLALQQEFQNHKSNYALASLALRQGDRTAAAFYFRQALLKNPSPQAYIGLSSILSQESLFFDAVHSLQEGVAKFPESGELLNNLGMLYSKTNVADSAYYYLEKAEKNTAKSDIPATNLLAILARNTDSDLLDSLADKTEKRDYLAWKANWLAVQNLRQEFSAQTLDVNAIPADSLLSVSSFAYLLNYTLNQAKTNVKTAALLNKLAPKNPVLSKDLSWAALYPEFYSGNKLNALQVLTGLAVDEEEKGDQYHKVLGHWFLQLGLYEKAIESLSVVEGVEGTIGMAVANALYDKKEVAVILLDKIEKPENRVAIENLKQNLFSGVKPKSLTDSLLAVAVRAPSDANFEKLVKANPFDAKGISATSEFLRNKKQIDKAYKIVLNALAYNEYDPGLWQQYAYLSLEQGLTGQAGEGENKVKQYATPADYQQFMSRYQPMQALIEKQRAEFQ